MNILTKTIKIGKKIIRGKFFENKSGKFIVCFANLNA